MDKFDLNIRNSNYMSILNLFLPKQVDNTNRVPNVILYFFYAIVCISIVRSLIHILASDGGSQSIATLPIDQYTKAGKESVIFMFAMWGLSQLIMGLWYLVVAIRYRSLIPLMYVFIFVEYFGRIIIGHFKSVTTIHTAPGEINSSATFKIFL